MSATATTTDFYKKKNDYNSIHQDEVEAGSILVALSNHKPKSSMSIYNLLESEQHKTIRKYEPPHDKQHLPSTPPNDLTPYKPDVIVNGRMQTISGEAYFGHMHQQKYHQQQRHNQQQQQQPHAYGRRYHPYHSSSSSKKPTTIIVSKQQQLPQNHHEFSRQYMHMKQNPKIRRNALQAYISYMTYTDIARKKMKQGVHTTPTLSPPHAYQYQQKRYDPQQQPSRPPPTVVPATVDKLIVDKPLTAFLHCPPPHHQSRFNHHLPLVTKRDTR
ncbi:hypothetical protein BD770DRAFT_471879 [Pilaira anomala]|nr:hypothetical protein BD770DRAFT_471879 [Pilaira anomala]